MRKTLLASAIVFALSAAMPSAIAKSIVIESNGSSTDNINVEATGVLTYTTGNVKTYGLFGIFPNSHDYAYQGQNNTISVDANNKYHKTDDGVMHSLSAVGIEALNKSKFTLGTKGSTNVVTVKSPLFAMGIRSAAGSNVVINGSSLVLNVEATSSDDVAYGLYAQNATANNTPLNERARLEVNTENTVVIAKAGKYGNSSALVAMSEGILEINSNLKAVGDNALLARGDAKVSINSDGQHITELVGDINFNYDGPTSGTSINSDVTINLTTPNSYWNGNVKVTYNQLDPSKLEQIQDLLTVKGMKLGLTNGAQWTPSAVIENQTVDGDNYQTGTDKLALNSLTLDEGIINVTGEDIDVTVEKMTGSGTVNLATDGMTAGKFNVETADDKASLNINLMDTKLEKQLTADEINSDQAKKLMANVGGKDANGNSVVSTTTAVPEGMVNNAFNVDAAGKSHEASANTLMQSSLELASAAPLALNRIMMNDVRKRLGDIRTSNGTHGAWARYDGGKLSGEGGLENDFHTIQVGIDTVPTADAPRMGVAFSYTDSDAEYARGSADMKAYSLAMYSTWMGDNGQFFDLIGRMGTADTDMVVDGQHKGSMDNVALSMSGEFGWRFDVTNSIYVEPQVEATYTYVNEDSLSLSTANYDVDAVHSLLGRIGFAAGMKCPSDFGNVYVRASAVHEFLGDSKITGVNAGNTNVYEIDGKDTWFEYGIGANFNITKSTYMWADVERTTGGALDEDWRATVGVRYAW